MWSRLCTTTRQALFFDSNNSQWLCSRATLCSYFNDILKISKNQWVLADPSIFHYKSFGFVLFAPKDKKCQTNSDVSLNFIAVRGHLTIEY